MLTAHAKMTTTDALVNAYRAVGPILINQGLAKKDFDIKFPVGTKVHDEIQGKKYIVK